MNKPSRFICALVVGSLTLPFASFGADTTTASDRDEIVHVLNRITFGPRPGDVDMVQKMGLRNYIEQQLHPETIDDSAVEQEITELPMVQMSATDLATLYRDEKKGKKEKKTEGAQAVIAADKAAADPATASTPAAVPPPTNAKGKVKVAKDKNDDDWKSNAAIEQLEQAKLVRAIDSNRQLQEVLADFWNNHFNVDVKKKECRVFKVADDRDAIRPHIWGKFRDLLSASAHSPAMLAYLDNATSTAPKAMDMASVPVTTSDEPMMQQVATKENPAAPMTKKEAKKADKGGLNENYGREIMELHTLGVDGGYTQKDVTEVARCFTGWSISKKTGEFVFNAKEHDNGPKLVLGHQIPAGGGIKDGETVLDILASSPATAHHISLELCQRFVSDNPPAALVDRIAAVFTKTDGDLRQVTEAILTSPEFLSPANYNSKIKSPLEFAVSAVRASGSSIVLPVTDDRREKKMASTEGDAIRGKEKPAEKLSSAAKQSLNWHIYELGEPLFACTPPTGYKEVSTTWVSPGALIERLNFATALTSQELSDIQFDPKTVIGNADLDKPDDVLNQSASVLLQNHLSDPTRHVIEKTVLPTGTATTVNPNKLIALLIGSPEFQRK